MFPVLQNPLAFLARALIALLFIPAGIAKIIGFMGTMGYIAAMGVPFPAVAAVIATLVTRPSPRLAWRIDSSKSFSKSVIPGSLATFGLAMYYSS
jgi:hypothetical protein